MKVGVYIYALGSVAAGILDFLWAEFDPAHQPIQAWGDHIPGREVLAYITAIWLVVAGLAILWRRTAHGGAVALGLAHLMFTLFWLPRLYTAPHVLGFRAPVVIGVSVGVFEQLILVAAAVILYAFASDGRFSLSKATLVARWTFGIGSLIFGVNHLLSMKQTAAMVPTWMPLGANFWVVLTGIAFILAGLAILSRVLGLLAAWLLGLMLLVFSALALAPLVFAYPHAHAAWGGNAYNLMAVGAAWILAGALASRRPESAESDVRRAATTEPNK
jgi:uncharacterized membrane protein